MKKKHGINQNGHINKKNLMTLNTNNDLLINFGSSGFSPPIKSIIVPMEKRGIMLLTGFFLLFIALISNCQVVITKEKKMKLIAEIDSILQSQVDLDKIPGAVVLIKKNTQVICQHAYGYAQKYDYNHNLLNPPEKMTVNHLFDIASLTKVIGTTTSVMLLADRGQINIEDPVCKYIKTFNTPDKKEITISNLLTHSAGLFDWYPLYYFVSNKQECYKLIGDLPLKFPVGELRRYSDLGFILLGEIIEIVSGLPLEQFMKQNIFQPLSMKNTDFNPLTSFGPTKIASTSAGNPYEKRMVYDSSLGFKIKEIDPARWNGWRTHILRGEVNDGITWYASGGISGAAGLFSTANDLQKLVDMLINKGMVDAKQFITGKTVKTFLTKNKFNNGLGWMMDPTNSFLKNAPEGSFGHTGFTGTSITVIPRDKISIILLINRQNIGLLKNGEYYNVNPVRLQVFNAVSKYL
jgi:serine-type D-Ala-D-Ala carboxypeptidase